MNVYQKIDIAYIPNIKTSKFMREIFKNKNKFPKKNIYYDTSYSDGCMKKTVSNARFRHFYPDYRFVQLDDGLKITTDWFEKNIDTIRK